MIAAVTMPALVAFRQLCGVDLEIGAGQIIEQHIEAGVEQVAPASDQVREQRVLVLEQPVVTGIELVRLGQTKIAAQQVDHGTVAKPCAMQLPFAARGDQPIGHQNLEDLVPARPFAARRQALGPEPVQLQFAPQLTREPARSPLPRPPQTERRETKSHHPSVIAQRFAAVLREQRQRARHAGSGVEHLDRLTPNRSLG